jgi:hypothetical protein
MKEKHAISNNRRRRSQKWMEEKEKHAMSTIGGGDHRNG